jgi:hypothetical protein
MHNINDMTSICKGANGITQATPTCFCDCFWKNIPRMLLKNFEKNLLNFFYKKFILFY